MIFDLPEKEKTDSEKLYFQNVYKPLTGENPHLKVFVKFGNGEYMDTGISYTPSDHTWVGAKIGIYALGSNSECKDAGFADFYYVKTTEL